MNPLAATTPQATQTDNSLLRAALDAMSEGVAILDAQDHYVFWNRRYAELHSESRHLQPGVPFRRILELGLAEGAYPEAVGRETEWLEGRLSRHEQHLSAEEQELPDGRWVRIEERRTADRGSISVAVDISDLKHRELELRRTKSFLDAVVESVPTMLIVRDAVDHRVVLFNRAGEDLLGMDRGEVLGKTPHELFPPDEAERSIQRDREVIDSGRLGVFEEEPITTRLQGVRYIQTKKLVMPRPDGSAEHLLSICEDITDRKAAAEALAEARDAAETANRAKSEFLANMSHEIRTPLNGVVGLAQVLSAAGLAPPHGELVEVIAKSATVLERLLSDILDLAAAESGRLDIRPEPHRLRELLERVAALHRAGAEEKGLTLAVEMVPGADVVVMVDAHRLEQILGNLLSNAVKFTDRGSVVLAVDRTGGGWRLRVTDTGRGFDPAHSEAIFDRFHQADGSSTRRHGGTGLGLAIARNLAQAMGGALTASSRPGQGSVFDLTLPLER